MNTFVSSLGKCRGLRALFGIAVALGYLVQTAPAQLFSDDFTRGSDPGPLAPWTNQVGTWTVTQGVMRGGINPTFSYGVATITNNFTNCSVQAQVQFPVGAFGGGVGGRVNPATGARYEAWLYPENSAGGSNVLKLLKFQNYSAFGYLGTSFAAMATTNLAAVGTNFHLLKLDMTGNQITVSYDTNQAVMVVTDAESTYYTNGAVSLAFWTDAAAYSFTADNVVVNPLPLVASNDTYTAVAGLVRTVPAPGVLGNDSGGLGPLQALLVSGPTKGTLTLTNNGGFRYLATNGYTGPDSFTYRATDGVSTSSVATVSISVSPDTAPVANNDAFSVQMNGTLTIAAPGVLANDTDADGNTLTAILATGVANGTLALSSNGGFTYTPNANFSGSDSFTYRANDGLSNSVPATVFISVLPPGLFSDDFTRGSDPGPLTPWTAQAGTWTVTGGIMQGGLNTPFSYAFATISSNWGDYVVSARIKLPAGAFGGGIGARLDPVIGSHYAAWIYPEGSSGGSNVLRLIKFQNFNSFTYLGVPAAPMATVNLASVGTNFHTIALAMSANQIAVYLDGAQMISMADTEATPYTNGAVSLDFWTDAASYLYTADDVLVRKLAGDNSYSINENTLLSIPAPGVLGDDTAVYTTSLIATLITPPAHGNLSLSNNGAFTYLPTNFYNGPDSFSYRADDGTTNVGTASVNITVNAVNQPPILPAQTNRTVVELVPLVVTNTATDVESPPEILTYVLRSPPTGVTIDTNGIIRWTPSEQEGPGTYTLTTVVTDNGVPPASATNSFTVTVLESNTPPVLPVQTNRTINELTLMTVNNTATDTDYPANILTYSLLTGPSNAVISSSGIITWTPTEAQGPMVTNITTRVVDNGVPPLSDTNSFTVTVLEVNSAPILPVQVNRTIGPGTTLTVTNTATDTDIPANNLAYALLISPPTAAISSSGIITWATTLADDRSTNIFQTVVTDDGAPPLSSTNTFTVFVNTDPVLTLNSTTLVQEGCLATNNAIDPGETVTVLFSLQNVGAGNATNLVATMLASNGIVPITPSQIYGAMQAGGAAVSQPYVFAATGSCGGSITATLQLQDGARDLGSVSASFTLGGSGIILTQNFDSVTAPALPAGWTTTNTGGDSLWITTNTLADTLTNAAFAGDPTVVGTTALISPPIALPLGLAQLNFRHRYALESSNSIVGYDGGVLEIKIGTNAFKDVIAAGGSFVTGGYDHSIIYSNYSSPIIGRQAWSGTNNAYTNVLVTLPASAAGQTVQLRWLLATDNGGAGGGWRVDSIGLVAAACCTKGPPTLPPQNNLTIAELTTLTVTNTATDAATRGTALVYSLVGPPVGAEINASGVITWTPNEAQGPGVYTLTTVVSDDNFPPFTATNSFQVTVTEVNSAPTLPILPDITIGALTTLVVTNTATDTDLPPNVLTYTLVNPPGGAGIDSNGIITWTPSEAQSPGVYVIETIVTDDGAPPLSATNIFTVVVTQMNTAPVLPFQLDRTIAELSLLLVTNTATDSSVPPVILSYALINPPLGAVIDTNGIITWIPNEAQGPSTNLILTVVTDNGAPPLSATNAFTVVVTEVNSAPILPSQPDATINELTTLTVTNTATDTDLPANLLTYQLVGPPPGALISTNGIITWTPTESQGPSTNTLTTVVTDNGVPPLSATNSFQVTVLEVNSAPVLPPQPDVTIDSQTLLVVTNTASDSDLPPNLLTYQLSNPPLGAAVDGNGTITWTPTTGQAGTTNAIVTIVTDNGVPPLSATNSFKVFVNALALVEPDILAFTADGSTATITWRSAPGRTYRVQYRTNITDTGWIDLVPDVVATGATASASYSITGVPQRFYHVVAVP